jgi:histone H3/H4
MVKTPKTTPKTVKTTTQETPKSIPKTKKTSSQETPKSSQEVVTPSQEKKKKNSQKENSEPSSQETPKTEKNPESEKKKKVTTPAPEEKSKKTSKKSKSEKNIISTATKAGVLFPPPRFLKLMKHPELAKKMEKGYSMQIATPQRVSTSAGVYLSGVIQHLVTELLNVAVVSCEAEGKKVLQAGHFLQGIREDLELNELCKNVDFVGGVGDYAPLSTYGVRDVDPNEVKTKKKKTSKNNQEEEQVEQEGEDEVEVVVEEEMEETASKPVVEETDEEDVVSE